ncbi:hypothetical protein FVEN_g12954 [Fusarium venenatum]|uniref:BTB domain-containing protein n=1 Tax=Fusarium venenatum TaxID=56646 RepID=A0A2L2TL41_9HYPO|nr:uncharacterized protein FVRRES_00388 [Fusarium venenatum]KAG8352855.1 hypothetical protein FVEN_g12954 [Fusarium venenatum]CEI63876.1 unnamed protein product [Fusarium venenatum]
MKVIRHEIDPKGDLLIVLKHPNTLNLMPDPPTKHESYRPPHPYYDDPSDDEEVEIEFRVCSLRMIQSSTLFKKMFGGPSKEAVEEATASSHLRKVSATDWNGDALAVVLNIIHDRTGENDVPQEPSTFLLAHITVIVDNYRCEECTHSGSYVTMGAKCHMSSIRGYRELIYFTGFLMVLLPHLHSQTCLGEYS